jgi:hypothetical protein
MAALRQRGHYFYIDTSNFYILMVKHIVSFKLTGTAEQRRAVAQKFKDALLALPAQIDVLQSMEVGINENPAEDWDVVLTAVVPTMADVATYATHPAHVAAAALLAGHKELRACVDYEF